MIEFLQQQFQNEFLSGGAFLMVLGAIGASLRKVPSYLYTLAYRRMVTYVDVPDQDEAFYWLQKWLAGHPYSKTSRLLTITTKDAGFEGNKMQNQGSMDESDSSAPTVAFTPAVGFHLLKFEGKWILLTRIRKEQQGSSNTNQFWREMFVLQTFVKDREFLRRLMLKAKTEAYPESKKRIEIFAMHPHGHGWNRVATRLPRSTDSVILAEGYMDNLTTQVSDFFGSMEWYQSRGIPYQMGYLFYGPPGNGKTSLAVALASKFGRSLYLARVSGVGDEAFRSSMGQVPKHSIVLIEDVDCFFDGREVVAAGSIVDSQMNFSSFLNAIDGVAGSEGRLLIMTTNHKDKLDPALIRPGRVDHQVEIADATYDQTRKLFLQFFPEETELSVRFADAFSDKQYSMASLQGYLLNYKDDPTQAVLNKVPDILLERVGG